MFQYIILAYPMYIMYSTLCICIILKYKVLNSLYTIHVIQCIYHIQNIFTYIYITQSYIYIYIYDIYTYIYIYICLIIQNTNTFWTYHVIYYTILFNEYIYIYIIYFTI